MCVRYILWHFWQHYHIYCFWYKFGIRPSTTLFDIFHGQLVDLLYKPNHLIFDVIGSILLFLLLNNHVEMYQFLLAENALDGIVLISLPKSLNNCPNIEQNLFITDLIIVIFIPKIFFFYRKHTIMIGIEVSKNQIICCNIPNMISSCRLWLYCNPSYHISHRVYSFRSTFTTTAQVCTFCHLLSVWSTSILNPLVIWTILTPLVIWITQIFKNILNL